MNSQTPVLEFDRVSLRRVAHSQTAMREIGFRLLPGDLLWIQVEPGNEHLPLADAAEGLVAPDEGTITFLGAGWSTVTPDRELSLRARIGRVFEGHGWISNLNVLENLTLAQRHHTDRPIADIITEAQCLARSFGFADVPRGRPAGIPGRDLQRAEWIRAFMGHPALILLERPMFGVAREYGPMLIREVEQARSRGTAVIWIHDDEVMPRSLSVPKCLRFRVRGDTILAAGEDG